MWIVLHARRYLAWLSLDARQLVRLVDIDNVLWFRDSSGTEDILPHKRERHMSGQEDTLKA